MPEGPEESTPGLKPPRFWYRQAVPECPASRRASARYGKPSDPVAGGGEGSGQGARHPLYAPDSGNPRTGNGGGARTTVQTTTDYIPPGVHAIPAVRPDSPPGDGGDVVLSTPR